MHSWRPKLPTACWKTSSGTGLPSGRRISVEHVERRGAEVLLDAEVERLRVAQAPAPSPVRRTTYGVQAT